MKVSHVENLLQGFHCLPAYEKRARLEKIYQLGGMEALETASLLTGWSIHRVRCMAGVEAKRVGRKRYSRTGRPKPALEEFYREVEALALAACGGRGEARFRRSDATASTRARKARRMEIFDPAM
ncbi:hypothetical protein PTH_2508 [Pelotomaculum thermopropionicum SI]|uniref:Uncharacterized protein n=1 Tax=Pelotomaculum thermopropionicum (strain DSM 13744 / JCM 10971 / SI) TaxID=370438 RepID=A5CZ83_PELTS|nr:hypothetical protein PTH_2508 [Pelotomaculum thermopropionicum SI]